MEIKLDKFIPRDYQLGLCDAIENKGYKKAICVFPRRAGKDFVAFNLMLRAAIRRIGLYVYCLPIYNQCRTVIFQAISIDGTKFLDFIPRELIKSINQMHMEIHLINGSIIKLIGSNKYDNSLRGTNPLMVVFSEYATSLEDAYILGAKPILHANDGTVIILSTPAGKNHLYELFRIAKDNPDVWYSELLTVEDTKHISIAELEADIARGEISREKAMQEYWCSFDRGTTGSYYFEYINKAKLEERISSVPYEPMYPVNTAWDIGINDETAIVFFSAIGTSLHIIDYYENHSQGLEHYAKILKEKGYVYGVHFGPHDLRNREWISGNITRVDKARELGINFKVVPKLSLSDGIEQVKTVLPRCYFDEKKCVRLIKCLENYHREYDDRRKTYLDHPVHDWASNAADAVRYMSIGIKNLKKDTSAEELEKRYRDTVYGNDSNLPPIFRS